MTHDYKKALDDLNGVSCDVTAFEWFEKHSGNPKSTVATALQLAQEAEQVRNRLAELETLLAQANNKIQWYERTEATND